MITCPICGTGVEPIDDMGPSSRTVSSCECGCLSCEPRSFCDSSNPWKFGSDHFERPSPAEVERTLFGLKASLPSSGDSAMDDDSLSKLVTIRLTRNHGCWMRLAPSGRLRVPCGESWTDVPEDDRSRTVELVLGRVLAIVHASEVLSS